MIRLNSQWEQLGDEDFRKTQNLLLLVLLCLMARNRKFFPHMEKFYFGKKIPTKLSLSATKCIRNETKCIRNESKCLRNESKFLRN